MPVADAGDDKMLAVVIELIIFRKATCQCKISYAIISCIK